MLAAAGVSDGRITPAALRWCIARASTPAQIDRIALPGLKPERRAVLPGGLAILYTLLTQFGIEALWPAKGALRQGVIVDLHDRREALQRSHPVDMRDRSVAAMQRRFGVDRPQALRVRELALGWFDAVCPDAPLSDRRELGWACDLHEIGLMVSHHDHHRHSAYLLAHADAPGFSQSEQRRIGELVIGQRGSLRKVEGPLARRLFAWQLLCLRLAVIKCHARGKVDPRALTLRARGTQALLRWPATWPAQRPRTLFLLREEAQVWVRNGTLDLVLPAPRADPARSRRAARPAARRRARGRAARSRHPCAAPRPAPRR